MAEKSSQYSPQFQENVKGVVVGEGNIIYNYFYASQTKIVSEESAETEDGEALPCPYKGLFHFTPEDSEYFFGREAFVTELVELTKSRRFLPLLGASGSGKSSVVFAGLVPALQQTGHWKFTYFRPGGDPFYNLALALVPLYNEKLDRTDLLIQAKKLAPALQNGDLVLSDVLIQIQQYHSNRRVLLIADQFEELYTLCTEFNTRQGFLNCLVESFSDAAKSITDVVLMATMRADFLGNALSYRPFADMLADDVKLGAMNRDELARVVTEPAQKLGVTFEEGLVDRILNDVESEPGNLPLLEFALTQLWNKRTGTQLTHDAYGEIGEVQGALTHYADRCLERERLKGKREEVRRIFVQLVRPGQGAEDTRRLATKADLGEENWQFVKQLADERLVVTSRNAEEQETVEVVHEALIRSWGELRQWMEADRSFRVWQERLRSLLRQWEEIGRSDDGLLRGVMLAQAEEWLDKRRKDISPRERGFIEASAERRAREVREQQRQRRLTIGGLTGASLLFFSLAVGALWQWRQTELAQSDVLTRSAEQLFAVEQPLEASLEGLRARAIRRRLRAKLSVRQVRVLYLAVAQSRQINNLTDHESAVNHVSWSPDGTTLASAS
ncbi:MAG: WD40 repeat domain-containing protein, partial [Baaleninema sp.]